MKILLLLITLSFIPRNEGLNIEKTEPLEFYIGKWISDTKKGKDETYHFTYQLTWFDKAHTIVKMKIMQENHDGSDAQLLWEGFKGWNESTQSLYYQGFSSSGQYAFGKVCEEDGKLITEYDGLAPSGVTTKVKDVFNRVDDTHFNSTTSIVKDGQWLEVMNDKWTRE